MTVSELTRDMTEFKNKNGESLWLIKKGKKEHLAAWKVADDKPIGGYALDGVIVNVDTIPISELQKIGAWDKLAEAVKSRLQDIEDGKIKQVQEKMEVARAAKRGRKIDPKYAHLPSILEYVCKDCGAERSQPRSAVIIAAEKKGLEVEEYMAEYQCQKCNPTKGRGRKPNPKYAGLPDKLVCKCGNSVTLNPSNLERKAERDKTTIEELIKNYQCQTCNPTKGRGKRKKRKGKK